MASMMMRRLTASPIVNSRLLPRHTRLCATFAQQAHTAIETDASELHPPFARYAHACKVPADSELIFTSGQLGIEVDGTIPSGAEAQTALAFRNIRKILVAAGADPSLSAPGQGTAMDVVRGQRTGVGVELASDVFSCAEEEEGLCCSKHSVNGVEYGTLQR